MQLVVAEGSAKFNSQQTEKIFKNIQKYFNQTICTKLYRIYNNKLKFCI